MGRATRSVPRDRMSQKRLDAMIINPAPAEREIPHGVLTGSIEYDTLHPDVVLRDFCSAIQEMLAQYEFNRNRISELEAQMQDLLHYIELTGDKNANAGFKLYRQMRYIRRERRACKNELDLLQPVYDAFYDTGLLNRLADVQGKCNALKLNIDGRNYAVRTDILEGL